MIKLNELFSRISKSLFLMPSYIKNLVSLGHQNYIFLTPPFFAQQVIYSKRTSSFISYKVQSVDQLKAAIQIFADEEYSDLSGRLSEIYTNILSHDRIPLVLDIGANIGLASLYFLDNFPLARIFAVEPSYETYLLCSINLSNHKLATVLHRAISNFSGYGTIANPRSPSWARLVEEADINLTSLNSEFFKVFTLDETFDSLHCATLSPFILKLDVEGAEKEILEIQPTCLSKFPAIFIETHDFMFPRKGHARPVLKTLSALNNDFLIKGENILSIRND
jgi:FkbM family methyltransferase